MAPSKADVHAMVTALFTLTAGMERARRQRKAAGTLSLLQLLAGRQPLRPSEIAEVHGVHPSLVTRQVRELEDAGLVQVAADPADGRSCLVTLTPAEPASCSGSPRPAWTGSPCSSRTGSRPTCGYSPRCWTSSGTPSPPSPRRSSSSARPAVAGQAHPGRISGTGSRQERRYPGAPRRHRTAVRLRRQRPSEPAATGARTAALRAHLRRGRSCKVRGSTIRAWPVTSYRPGVASDCLREVAGVGRNHG